MNFDNPDWTTAQRIRAIIGAEGTTIAAVAEKIGTTRQNLTTKLKRNNLSESEMREVAEALGYDLIIEFQRKPQ